MWRPTNEEQLLASISTGDLQETQVFEVKQEVKTGDSASRELAADLAQFALDGGVLLIGVKELKDTRPYWEPAPVPLAGFSERISQIARSRIDPPLRVAVSTFPSAADDSVGYVVVEVPASPMVLHMVGGRYYGRADKDRYPLTDPDVARLHAARRVTEQETERLLDIEIERDPYQSLGSRGHLYLVAQPLIAPADLARELVAGDVRRLLQMYGEAAVHEDLRHLIPTPSMAGGTPKRANGVALCSPELVDAGRRATTRADAPRQEKESFDVELREDGGLRVFVGRLTETQDGVVLIKDAVAIAWVSRLTEWARSVSAMTGYKGRWLLGMAGTQLRGRRSSTAETYFREEGHVYDAETYRRTTSADFTELSQQPGDVVERLIGPLLRGLGTDAFHKEHVHYPTTVRARTSAT